MIWNNNLLVIYKCKYVPNGSKITKSFICTNRYYDILNANLIWVESGQDLVRPCVREIRQGGKGRERSLVGKLRKSRSRNGFLRLKLRSYIYKNPHKPIL